MQVQVYAGVHVHMLQLQSLVFGHNLCIKCALGGILTL